MICYKLSDALKNLAVQRYTPRVIEAYKHIHSYVLHAFTVKQVQIHAKSIPLCKVPRQT